MFLSNHGDRRRSISHRIEGLPVKGKVSQTFPDFTQVPRLDFTSDRRRQKNSVRSLKQHVARRSMRGPFGESLEFTGPKLNTAILVGCGDMLQVYVGTDGCTRHSLAFPWI